MKGIFLYLGLGLLFTHEMDAISNHEWRVLPIINTLDDTTGELVFLVVHIPIFALVIAFVASLNRNTRLLVQKLLSAFLVVHGALHFVVSGHTKYEFSSVLSHTLIYGAALCGIAYFLVTIVEGHR